VTSKSSTNKPNHRIKCSYCNKYFLIKSYSSHLMREHKNTIFKKDNLDEFKRVVKNKSKVPIEVTHRVLKGDDKVEFFVPCCNKFFSRDYMAIKHLESPECRVCYITNAEKLLNEISGISTSIVVDISGNNNTANTHTTTNNIVNNGTLIMDNSGNIVDLITLIKKLNTTIDYLQYENALNAKKRNKYKSKLATIHEDTESDVSDIESIYSGVNDDVSDKEVYNKRFDIQKKLKTFVKKEGLNIDLSKLSRDALNLKTGYDKAKEIREKEQEEKIRLEEEKEQLEQEKADYEEEQQYNKYKREQLEDKIKMANVAINDILINADMSNKYNQQEVKNIQRQIDVWESELRNIGKIDSDTESKD